LSFEIFFLKSKRQNRQKKKDIYNPKNQLLLKFKKNTSFQNMANTRVMYESNPYETYNGLLETIKLNISILTQNGKI